MSESAQRRIRCVHEAHPRLESALQTQHRIVGDIRRRFTANGYISPKQLALVYKLRAEVGK